MKILKGLLKVLAGLLLVLLLALIGFRQWCVWKLPRLRAEVNTAWQTYAGTALDDVPRKFLPVKTNDAALQLEKAAAKLGICLAPAKNDEKCPRHAPTEEAVKELEALSVKVANGDKKSWLNVYVDKQMEKSDPQVEPPPPELETYLSTHREDITALLSALDAVESPHWEFNPSQENLSPPDHIPEHLTLFRLLVAEGFTRLSRREVAGTESLLKGLNRLNGSLLDQPETVRVLIGVAEGRMLNALSRKIPQTEKGYSADSRRIDWRQEQKKADLYFNWQTTTPETVVRYETMDMNWDDAGKVTVTKKKRKISERLTRPWTQISFLQMNMATLHDMKYFDGLDSCQPNQAWESILQVSFPNKTWYRPEWLIGITVGAIRHPELSWWNATGKIIYAIGGPSRGTWKRMARLDQETELTQKVMMLRAARAQAGSWPASIPGIETSICKNEKWNYAVTPDGAATLTFSGKLDWTGMKGAQVPLQWTEPAP